MAEAHLRRGLLLLQNDSASISRGNDMAEQMRDAPTTARKRGSAAVS